MQEEIAATARAAKEAAKRLTKVSTEDRNRALVAIADAVRSSEDEIIRANHKDLDAATKAGLSPAMIDRLRLTPQRIAGVAKAVSDIAAMPDIVGRLERTETRPNGLVVSRMRIPLGVVAIIYESRPNVTTDAAALCLKSGNAAILRGGSEAFHSNRALGRAVAEGLERAGLPPAAVQVVGTTDRAGVEALLKCDREIDLVIPRGGDGLIRFVSENSRIPVLKHYKGVCHLVVDKDADLAMAMAIAENAKVQRPGVCNALETILVDRAIAATFVPEMCKRYSDLGVEVRGDDDVQALANTPVVAATDEDWDAEYLDLRVAMRVVDDLDAAIDHIAEHGSNHTESIITTNDDTADRFLSEIQSSTVMVNASTRFADGGELGLGAEIGISTTKLHAYGPMGAEGLTTTKFVVRGQGQVRQ